MPATTFLTMHRNRSRKTKSGRDLARFRAAVSARYLSLSGERAETRDRQALRERRDDDSRETRNARTRGHAHGRARGAGPRVLPSSPRDKRGRVHQNSHRREFLTRKEKRHSPLSMYGTSSSSSRKETYPHVSLIIVIQYSPLQSGHAPRWIPGVGLAPPFPLARAKDRSTNKTKARLAARSGRQQQG